MEIKPLNDIRNIKEAIYHKHNLFNNQVTTQSTNANEENTRNFRFKNKSKQALEEKTMEEYQLIK